MKFTIKGKRVGDKVEFKRNELLAGLANIPEGSSLLITITDQRSIDQNSLLHSYLTEISNETGESLEDIKSYLKHTFLGYEIHKISVGCDECEEVKELRHTSHLTVKEFATFITQIEAWAWENLRMTLNKKMYEY